jgi:hypothetical protein
MMKEIPRFAGGKGSQQEDQYSAPLQNPQDQPDY